MVGCHSAVQMNMSRLASGTVEAWARSPQNPVGGWYGLTKGSRGGFANFVPPIMKTLNLAEVEGGPQGGRMRAV